MAIPKRACHGCNRTRSTGFFSSRACIVRARALFSGSGTFCNSGFGGAGFAVCISIYSSLYQVQRRVGSARWPVVINYTPPRRAITRERASLVFLDWEGFSRFFAASTWWCNCGARLRGRTGTFCGFHVCVSVVLVQLQLALRSFSRIASVLFYDLWEFFQESISGLLGYGIMERLIEAVCYYAIGSLWGNARKCDRKWIWIEIGWGNFEKLVGMEFDYCIALNRKL